MLASSTEFLNMKNQFASVDPHKQFLPSLLPDINEMTEPNDKI
jgi:hypothetical protein